MEIDLNKALSYLHGEITPSKIKAILADIYPEKKLKRNLLAMVVEGGLVKKIQSSDIVSSQDYYKYQKILIDDYGIQPSKAEWAILTWINVYTKLEDGAINSANNLSLEPDISAPSVSAKIPIIPSADYDQGGNPDDYEFELLQDGTVKIVSFTGFTDENIVIPSYIDGKAVTIIGEEVFKNCKGIKNITLPKKLHTIEGAAFRSCGIIKISLPAGIREIKWGAFHSCSELIKVDFPNTIESIGEFAFAHCWKLAIVDLFHCVNLRIIHKQAFSHCDNLLGIYLNEGLTTIEDDAFIHANMGLAAKDVLIPSTLVNIGRDVFGDYTNKRKVYCYPKSIAISYFRNNGHIVRPASEYKRM